MHMVSSGGWVISPWGAQLGDMTQRGMCLTPEPAGVHAELLHAAILTPAVLAVQARLLFWRQARRCGLDA